MNRCISNSFWELPGAHLRRTSFFCTYMNISQKKSTWSIIGIGKNHLPMSMIGLTLGGHVRVGMEDNIYYDKGVLATSNAQFVKRIVRITKAYGREVASPDETRTILGLGEPKDT